MSARIEVLLSIWAACHRDRGRRAHAPVVSHASGHESLWRRWLDSPSVRCTRRESRHGTSSRNRDRGVRAAVGPEACLPSSRGAAQALRRRGDAPRVVEAALPPRRYPTPRAALERFSREWNLPRIPRELSVVCGRPSEAGRRLFQHVLARWTSLRRSAFIDDNAVTSRRPRSSESSRGSRGPTGVRAVLAELKRRRLKGGPAPTLQYLTCRVRPRCATLTGLPASDS